METKRMGEIYGKISNIVIEMMFLFHLQRGRLKLSGRCNYSNTKIMEG